MEFVVERHHSFEEADDLLPTAAHANAEEFMYRASENGDLDRAAELFQEYLAQKNATMSGEGQPFDYANFPRPAMNYSILVAAAVCNLLGAFCILLNVFVIFALLRNRRRVLQNVFYVLVLHCSFVDLIRGSCLVVWGLPHLMIHSLRTMQERLLVLKINQFILILLRSCNLLTIFMLLIFTVNEYIVIRFPLHYRRYFRRRTVLIILACSWIVSLFFGVGSVFSNFFESAHSIMVLNNGSLHFRGNSTADLAGAVTRRPLAGISINVACMLIIFSLCYLCLALVLICYGTILRTIRQFHAGETKGRFCNEESQKFNRNTVRTVEIDREGRSTVVTATNSNAAEAGGTWTADGQPQPRCNSHKKWKSHLMSRHKYLLVIGSVLFVDILFLLPYSGIQLVAFLHLNNLLVTSPSSALIRWGLQVLIGVHSVCQPMCYFRMNEFRRLACCWQPKISRSKSFSQMDKSAGRSEGQSRDGAATNEEPANTPAGARARRQSGGAGGHASDPTAKRQPHAVRRLSRLLSRGLLESESGDSADEPPAAVLPAVEVEDPELPHTPTESELEHILDCGLGSTPFLTSNWSRVVGSTLKFRAYGEQREASSGRSIEERRPKLSTLSDMRSSTCFERESICLPDEPVQ
ncbi:Beta-2 adrenergic receptor [Aphelenchoides fujianensis]|nr:Beta-2 adrenergic receptor [Aphelenchoides fujianensis]